MNINRTYANELRKLAKLLDEDFKANKKEVVKYLMRIILEIKEQGNRLVKVYYLDKYRYPVELRKGRRFQNFLSLLIHTRRITTKRPRCLGVPKVIIDNEM